MGINSMTGDLQEALEELTGALSSAYSLTGELANTEPVDGSLGGALLRGYSAYDIAVRHGYVGTEEEWLSSLHANVHSQTKEAWDSQVDLIGEANHIYVYTDYYKETDTSGNIKTYPAIKIGDGNSYIVDLPVISDIQIVMNSLQKHILDTDVHTSSSEKSKWNNKIGARLEQETLILF